MTEMQIVNPFRPSKYEVDSHPLIWVSPIAQKLMREPHSAFVMGARGSGKTSILKSLDSAEQAKNHSLQRQVFGGTLRSFGVYFRMPDLFTQTITDGNWSDLMPTALDTKLVSTYFFSGLIEVTAVEMLLRNIHEWSYHGLCTSSLFAVDAALTKLWHRFTAIRPTFSTGNGLLDAATTLALHRSRMLQAFCDGDKQSFRELYRLSEPGEFLSISVDALLPLLTSPYLTNPRDIRIKILIDECDYLVPEQQHILNALVRKTKAPIDWIAAFVPEGFDATTTVLTNLSASVADRIVIDLDGSKDARFARLCQKVASYRIFYSLPLKFREEAKLKGPDDCFGLKKRLGDLRINDLIEFAGKASQSADFDKFRSEAVAFGVELNRLRASKKLSRRQSAYIGLDDGNAPQYYQTYALKGYGWTLEKLQQSAAIRESYVSTVRRKQRGLYLRMMSAFGVRAIPYAGYNIVIALSDSCIRDFLDIMASIFDAHRAWKSEEAYTNFCLSDEMIPINIQRIGTARASDDKFLGVQQRLPQASLALGKLIDALGFLTHIIQTGKPDLQSTSTEERGVFVLDVGDRSAVAVGRIKGLDVIRDVLEVGRRENIIVVYGSTQAAGSTSSKAARASSTIRFRLHRRFAPRYGFSFRGAYEPVRILPTEIASLFVEPVSELAVEAWAQKVGNRIEGEIKKEAYLSGSPHKQSNFLGLFDPSRASGD